VLYVIFVEDLRLVRWATEPNALQEHHPGTDEKKPPATATPSEPASSQAVAVAELLPTRD
jgi:hypothetical protein